MTVAAGYVLPVDKPVGPTSHDVVDVARRALGVRKIGHTGTLDPFASGLLLLCVGAATRVAEYLSGLDKSYEAEARLGVVTDTLDRDGAVLEERGGWASLSVSDVEAALSRFRGAISQRPPQFSAKKVGGVPMHRRARRGERVELAPRPVTIHALEITSWKPPTLVFRVRCSSGTYVRVLAADLGEALGCGAHLTALRRTSIGSVGVERALPIDALGDANAVARARIDLLSALAHLPAVQVGTEEVRRLAHGQRLTIESSVEGGLVAVANGEDLVAVADVGEGVLRPRKVFVA